MLQQSLDFYKACLITTDNQDVHAQSRLSKLIDYVVSMAPEYVHTPRIPAIDVACPWIPAIDMAHATNAVFQMIDCRASDLELDENLSMSATCIGSYPVA